MNRKQWLNPSLDKLSYLNSHQLEIVLRYRDPQLEVVENYSITAIQPANKQNKTYTVVRSCVMFKWTTWDKKLQF